MNNPKRASLLERAARVYDFNAALRARPGGEPGPSPDDAPIAEPLRAELARFEMPPAMPGRFGTIDREELREAGFILPDAPVSALAEEFRIVKRQLLLAAMEGGDPRSRRILVASALPGEGKSFCAVNLALSIANERDLEVLLVDADVAKPSILSMLGLEAGPGLMDAIADPAVDPEACVIRTDLGHLSVLPAGRQSNEATELIASDRTRVVVEALGRVPNRITIFDSPPALAASPASVLALHVGQTMMVVRADRTGEGDLKDALKLLAGCDDIRLLLNATSAGLGRRRFGTYYGYGA
ncbi:P-loop NTPase [Sphingomonas solaris]|uniref:Exopolysaccharide biosynthesis protein n=1 Tax=Alterirhizorhabdus solaris TaxID=2529389 RepID=A0A558R9R9_9SPHN|nr:P-loop NTPase [Sphingomonas solaris]TVV76129.1 exopolysaccharide biosynthesis protein [Sphingomonas solaris]